MTPSTKRTSLVTTLDGPLRSAVQAARQSVWLASPYVTGDVCDWLRIRARRGSAQWRLMTELNAGSAAYGSLNLNGLRALMAARVELRHVDGLHAKLFLTETQGFTGSANLTSAGLGASTRANAELTVVLDGAQRHEAQSQYERWWKSADLITDQDIDQCEQDAAKIPVRIARPPKTSRRKSSQIDKANRILGQAGEATTWAKAVYRGEEDFPWDSPWVASSSKGKPRFEPGDVLVVYAVYAQTCFTVLQVVGDTSFDVQRQIDAGVSREDADRWPWVTDVKLLLEVPPARGVPLTRLGLTGQSLRNGHCHMPVGGLAAALTAMST